MEWVWDESCMSNIESMNGRRGRRGFGEKTA